MEDRDSRSRGSRGSIEGLVERFGHHLEEANRRWQEDWGYRLPAPEHTHADLLEREDAFVAVVDLPGCERDEVDVTLTDRTLRIETSGNTERLPAAAVGGEPDGSDARGYEYVRRERAHRPRSRRIRIPGSVTATNATARLEDGVLTVVLPKAAAGSEEESIAVE